MLNTYLYYGLIFVVTGAPFYFQHQIQSLPKTPESIGRINQLSARMTALILGILFGQNFIATRTQTMMGYGACLFSCVLLFWFRGQALNQIQKVEVKPAERFQRSFRGLAGYAVIYGLYLLVVQILVPVTGTLPAIAFALIAINYSAPVLIQLWMPSNRMFPSSLKEEIQAVFKSAGNPVGEIYLIDSSRTKSYNALVCGPKWGFGPFQRSLFITQNLFETLEPAEIKAVICHEAAHFKLNHIFKRGLLSITGLVFSIFFIFLPLFFVIQLVNPALNLNPGVISLMSLMTIAFQFVFIFRVIRKQEFEADLGALDIGADPFALSSALEKISRLNGSPEKKEDTLTRLFLGSGHPHWRERIDAVFSRKIPEDTVIFPPWKYTVSYASLVLALGALTFTQEMERNHKESNRTVASVKDQTREETPTRQLLPTFENRFNSAEVGAEE